MRYPKSDGSCFGWAIALSRAGIGSSDAVRWRKLSHANLHDGCNGRLRHVGLRWNGFQIRRCRGRQCLGWRVHREWWFGIGGQFQSRWLISDGWIQRNDEFREFTRRQLDSVRWYREFRRIQRGWRHFE